MHAFPGYVFATALAFLLAGCSSLEPERRPSTPMQPVLEGKTACLDGQVELSARLSPFRLHGTPGDDNGGYRNESRERPKRRAGEHRDDEANQGFTIDKGPNVEHVDIADEDGKVRPPRWIGSASRQTIVISIRNAGSEPMEVHVEDVTSPIGNFVPVPETLTLQPGTQQDLEPMRASYPDAIEQLDVTVRIGVGQRHEEHTVRLMMASPPPGG